MGTASNVKNSVLSPVKSNVEEEKYSSYGPGAGTNKNQPSSLDFNRSNTIASPY